MKCATCKTNIGTGRNPGGVVCGQCAEEAKNPPGCIPIPDGKPVDEKDDPFRPGNRTPGWSKLVN
jgi:hypothetical protein